MKRRDLGKEHNPVSNIFSNIVNGFQGGILSKINQRTKEESAFINIITEAPDETTNVTFTTLKGIRLKKAQFKPRMLASINAKNGKEKRELGNAEIYHASDLITPDLDEGWEEEEVNITSREEKEHYDLEMERREDMLYEAVFNELFQRKTKDMSYAKRLRYQKFFSKQFKPRIIAYFNGMPVRLHKIRRKFQKVRRLFKRGGLGLNTMNEEKVNQDALMRMPAKKLRKGAPKQQLTKGEEDELELARMCCGLGTRGIWGGPQYSFGIFLNPDKAEELLSHWRGIKKEKVVYDQNFYDEVIENCNLLELTLMVVPQRYLTLPQMQIEYAPKLAKCMYNIAHTRGDEIEMLEFVKIFNQNRLRNKYKWITENKVKPTTKFLFSTRPEGYLAVEAISPGPLVKQKTTFVGMARSSKVTMSVFDMFLGDNPIDPEAKIDTALSLLYAIHGFKFHKNPSNPRQQTLDTYSDWGTGYVHSAVFDNDRLTLDDSSDDESLLVLSGVNDKILEEENKEFQILEDEAEMKAAYADDWHVKE